MTRRGSGESAPAAAPEAAAPVAEQPPAAAPAEVQDGKNLAALLGRLSSLESQLAAVQQHTPSARSAAPGGVEALHIAAPNGPDSTSAGCASTDTALAGSPAGRVVPTTIPSDAAPGDAPPISEERNTSDDGDGSEDGYDDRAGTVSPRPGLGSTAELRELISGEGRSLPCPHVDHNPWPKAPSLRDRALHYEPAAAGDSVHAAIAADLKRVNGDGAKELLQRELCTLVPVCSALYDLDAFLETVQHGVKEGVRAATIVQLIATARQQLFATRQLQQERLSGATHPSRRAAHSDLMYGHERSHTGARSALGEFLALSETTRTTTAHIGHAARDRASNARSTTTRQTLQARGNQQRRAAALLSQLGAGTGADSGRSGGGGGGGARKASTGEQKSSSGDGKSGGGDKGNGQGRGGRGGRGSGRGAAQESG